MLDVVKTLKAQSSAPLSDYSKIDLHKGVEKFDYLFDELQRISPDFEKNIAQPSLKAMQQVYVIPKNKKTLDILSDDDPIEAINEKMNTGFYVVTGLTLLVFAGIYYKILKK